MKKENWVWMPHAAHFIGGNSCRFHLATYVGKYIVSTVGEYWNGRVVREIHAKLSNPKWFASNVSLKGDDFDKAYMEKFGYEDIGYNRKYETMVFKAKKSEHKCCPYKMIVNKKMDMRGYNSADEAYQGHLELCEKWANK